MGAAVAATWATCAGVRAASVLGSDKGVVNANTVIRIGHLRTYFGREQGYWNLSTSEKCAIVCLNRLCIDGISVGRSVPLLQGTAGPVARTWSPGVA